MANYCGWTRTNYFKVKDEDAFEDFMSEVYDNEGQEVSVFTKLDANGETEYAFGCESSIEGIRVKNDEEEPEYSYDKFIRGLQEHLADGHAVIITEVGHEKLCYLAADAVIVTKFNAKNIRLDDFALKTARKMLKNNNYNPNCSY